MSTEKTTHRTYAWRRTLDHGSFEHAAVEREGNATRIRGEILATHEGAPLRLAYELATDERGFSRHLTVEQESGGQTRRLVLDRTVDGWSVNGRAAPELDGCSDIDLGLSPSTNALPIARMMSAGIAQAEVRVAWVRFPTLTATPAVQRYTHKGDRSWQYESLASGFNAELRVDDWHLPVTYEGVWEQAGVAHGHGPVARGGFAAALLADAPSPEIAANAGDFDWLVGGWDATVRDFADDGTVKESRGEWWFAWVLDGRAMQDVWISPPRAERRSQARGQVRGRYGTTIRRFDHERGMWRVSWFNPATGAEEELSGSRQGDAIVLLGASQGRPIKWQFVDIRTDRFTWQGYRLDADGLTWRLQAQFDLRRMNPTSEPRH